jgi:hypothetical protein
MMSDFRDHPHALPDLLSFCANDLPRRPATSIRLLAHKSGSIFHDAFRPAEPQPFPPSEDGPVRDDLERRPAAGVGAERLGDLAPALPSGGFEHLGRRQFGRREVLADRGGDLVAGRVVTQGRKGSASARRPKGRVSLTEGNVRPTAQ